MKIARRQFTAKLHPKGSTERARLNESSLTSEYMPSHKYIVLEDDGRTTPFTFRTKAEAEAKRFTTFVFPGANQKKEAA